MIKKDFEALRSVYTALCRTLLTASELFNQMSQISPEIRGTSGIRDFLSQIAIL